MRALMALLFIVSCRQPAQLQAVAPTGLMIPADVLTIRESSHPPTRAFLHRLVVSGSKARMSQELDRWRLFDFEAGTVTWVDDVAKTYRVQTLEELVAQRRRQLANPIPVPAATLTIRQTDETREIAGIRGKKLEMTLGGYRREIWLSDEPLISPQFLRMWVASEPISEPRAGVSRSVQETLMSREGFPLLDRSALVWEGGSMVSRRELMKKEKKDVPARWLTIPADYRNTTPGTIGSASDRRSAS